jgi:hypothetical protein
MDYSIDDVVLVNNHPCTVLSVGAEMMLVIPFKRTLPIWVSKNTVKLYNENFVKDAKHHSSVKLALE